MPRPFVVLVGSALSACAASAFANNVAQPDFERDIRPILVRHCVSCHGGEKQESGLRLDSPAGIRRGGDGGSAAARDVRVRDRRDSDLRLRLGSNAAVGHIDDAFTGIAQVPDDDVSGTDGDRLVESHL